MIQEWAPRPRGGGGGLARPPIPGGGLGKPLRTEGQDSHAIPYGTLARRPPPRGDAVETLIEFRDYLPPGDTLLDLALRFGDEIRELLGMPVLPRVSRGPERKPLDGLEDTDLGRLSRALVILSPEFADYLTSPEMISHLTAVFREVCVVVARRMTEGAKAS